MANTVTILADHLGLSAGPVAVGHEYRVDAYVDIATYTTGGEVVNASAFGLSSISAVVVTGLEAPATHAVVAEVSTAGAYASSSSIQLFSVDLDGTNAETASGATTIGAVRVRVWGSV